VLSSISILVNYGLTTGGPAGMIVGWLIGAAFTCLIGMALAEIAATYPSAGSVYHWSPHECACDTGKARHCASA
jgi:amino acid transporter